MYVLLGKVGEIYRLVNTETLGIEKYLDITGIKPSPIRVIDVNRSFIPPRYESQEVCYVFNHMRTKLFLWLRGYSFEVEFTEDGNMVYINGVPFVEGLGEYVLFMFFHHKRLILQLPHSDIVIYNGRILDFDGVIEGVACSQATFKREVLLKCFM